MTFDTSTWEEISFGEIARSLTNAVKNPLSENLVRYVGLEHVEPGNIHIKSWGNVADGTTFTRVFRKGQVLFGKRRAYQKKAAVAEFDGVCSGDILVLEAIEKRLSPELLPFIVQSDRFFDCAVKTSAGSLSPRTKFKDLAKFTFKLPPLNEQKRIADLLWSIDNTEQKYKVILYEIQNVKQSIIDSNLFNVTENHFELGAVGDVIRGVTFKPVDIIAPRHINKVMVLRANNINNNVINYEDVIFVKKDNVAEDQILKWGDFAICMSSGSKVLLGKAAEYKEDNESMVSVGAFCSIYRLDNLEEHLDLVKYYFQSSIYRKQVSLLLSGSNINNLKKSDILELRVPAVKSKEKSISSIIKIDQQLNSIGLQLKRLQGIKKQIINQIFE